MYFIKALFWKWSFSSFNDLISFISRGLTNRNDVAVVSKSQLFRWPRNFPRELKMGNSVGNEQFPSLQRLEQGSELKDDDKNNKKTGSYRIGRALRKHKEV